MAHPMMLVLISTITHERLDHISSKYHLIKEDGVVLPSTTVVIARPPTGMIGFYPYYFEVGLRVPPSPFSRSIVEANQIHTCHSKPNSISKIICFELLCHVALFVHTFDLFQYFFHI